MLSAVRPVRDDLCWNEAPLKALTENVGKITDESVNVALAGCFVNNVLIVVVA